MRTPSVVESAPARPARRSKKAEKRQPRVLFLVDNKWRDLPGDCLIARHLEDSLNANVWLEPLGNWRVAVGELKPHLVIFNHLTAAHLIEYARWLQSRGIKVVVLPNEGMAYHPEVRKFIAGTYHDNSVLDLFLSWNEPQKQAMMESGKTPARKIPVVGVPRFDFYFPPYHQALRPRAEICAELGFDPERPLLLFTSNFILARYDGKLAEAEKTFGQWKEWVTPYRNLPELIANDFQRRQNWLDWIKTLGKRMPQVQIILKPHPNENQQFFQHAIGTDPLVKEGRLAIVTRISIWELIHASDVIVSRNCTTAIEGWLCHKPTFDLFIDDREPFYEPTHAAGSEQVQTVEQLIERLDYYLKGGTVPPEILQRREKHLDKWCSKWRGRSCARIVEVLRPLLQDAPEPHLSRSLTDYRRMLKRRVKSLFGVNYSERFQDHIYLRLKGYERLGREDRLVRPKDIVHWQKRIERALGPAH